MFVLTPEIQEFFNHKNIDPEEAEALGFPLKFLNLPNKRLKAEKYLIALMNEFNLMMGQINALSHHASQVLIKEWALYQRASIANAEWAIKYSGKPDGPKELIQFVTLALGDAEAKELIEKSLNKGDL